MNRPRVIVPGIWNSDADHWQSHWERADGADSIRIAPRSWTHPDPDDWVAAIDRAVRACAEPPVLVAHSLGVLAAARWLGEQETSRQTPDAPRRAAGAFLVAPPDPTSPSFPAEARGFSGPTRSVATPAVLVASDDDPWCSLDAAVDIADALGAAVVRVGPLGHVNVASGVGEWPEGRRLLAAFESDL